jgi:hypothetical protein
MKTTPLLFLLAFFTLYGTLNAQIPNSGFENWSGDALDGWHFTYSEPGYENVFQSADAYNGDYAVRLKPVYNNNLAKVAPALITTGMFPLTEDHHNLYGYVKGTLAGNDNIIIKVDLFKEGTTLAVGSFSTSQVASEWMAFTAPINYGFTAKPDSAYISIYVAYGQSASEGSDIVVDQVTFDAASGIHDRQQVAAHSLFPNPVTDRTTIRFTLQAADRMSFELLTPQGMMIPLRSGQHYPAGENTFRIQTNDLAPGIYFLQARGDKFGFVQKVVVER